MLRQFLVGAAVNACNIIIHALVMAALVRLLQRLDRRDTTRPWLLLIGAMIATVSILVVAHACEVGVWSICYEIVDAVPGGADSVYLAFVNYTTLGYGDVIPVQRWQLLGPITAMNGILMFGWSTAVIFAVMRRIMVRHSVVDALSSRLSPPG